MNTLRTSRTRGSVQFCRLAGCLTALAIAAPVALQAQEATPAPAASAPAAEGKGTLTGRVLNASNGMYLSKAVVKVVGSDIEVITGEYGDFRIENLPVGEVTLQASYTGISPITLKATIEAGKVVDQEIKLGRARLVMDKTDKDAVILDEFQVQSERFKNATEIAINEERYSTTIKNVIAAEAFGDIPDGNIGEFVKYIPGVQIGTGYENAASNAADSNATSISVRGFDAINTNITIDGVPVTNASPASLTRATGLDMMSINNASRVEVIKVATPDLPSNSPGGQINLITRSAFEYVKPELSWKMGLTLNSENWRDTFKKTDGPANKATYKTLPAVDFSYVIPLNKKMGFSVSGGWSQTFNENHQGKSNYYYGNKGSTEYTQAKNDQGNTAINLSAFGGPNVVITTDPTDSTKKYISNFTTTSGDVLSVANPLLRQYQVTDTPNTVTRTSVGLKFDWRPTASQKVSVGYTAGMFDGVDAQRRLGFSMADGKVTGASKLPAAYSWASWGKDYAYSYVPQTIGSAKIEPKSQVEMTVTARDRESTSQTAYIDYVFKRSGWEIDALASGSRSAGAYKDTENGHFSEIRDVKISGGSLRFENIKDGIPGTIRVGDTAGTGFVDYSNLSSWGSLPAGAIAQSGKVNSIDQNVTMKLNIRRELDFFPFAWMNAAFKTGVYREQKMVKKWGNGTGYRYRYMGTSSIPITSLLEDNYQESPGMGNLPVQQWISPYKFYQLFQDDPTLFSDTYTPNVTTANSDNLLYHNYNEKTNTNKKFTETSDQYYAMIDGRALKNRLTWVTGLRTAIDSRTGYGPQIQNDWNYIKDKDGKIYRDSTYDKGVKFTGGDTTYKTSLGITDPLFNDPALRARLTAAGITIPDTPLVDALERRKIQYKTGDFRGKVKGKPSFMMSTAYDLTKDVALRLSFNRSYAQPEMENTLISQQNGGHTITEAAEIPNPVSHDKPMGTIKMLNPSLKPWTADSYDAQVTYYTPSGGKFGISGFYKTVKDFHETYVTYWDESGFEDILNDLQLDPSGFEGYKVETTFNGVGTAKTLGYEVEFNQNLKVLGGWGKYFQVFASYSHQYKKQQNVVNSLRTLINTARPTANDTASAGVNFARGRLSVLVRGLFTDTKYKANGSVYRYGDQDIIISDYNPAFTSLDLNIRYSFTPRYGLFFNARNFLNNSTTTQRYDAKTGVLPAWAKTTETKRFGVNCIVGITGRF